MSRLSPDERIKELKKMQEKNKEEIEKAETLIAESFREIGTEEEKKKVPIPQMKATDITQLVSADEKEMFIASHGLQAEGVEVGIEAEKSQTLEETAEEEATTEQAKKGQKFKGYDAVEEAKAKQDPMSSYQNRKSITKAGEEKDRNVYEQQSVMKADGGGEGQDGYQSKSVSDTGGHVEHSYEGKEEKRKWTSY